MKQNVFLPEGANRFVGTISIFKKMCGKAHQSLPDEPTLRKR